MSFPIYRLSLILLFALLIRIAAAFYLQPSGGDAESLFRMGDSYSYWVLAEHIARGEPYQYGSPNASVFRAPLFPLFLAPFTTISNTWLAVMIVRLCGAALGLVVLVEIYILSKRLGGQRAGLIAAALAGMSLSAVGMSVLILSEMIFIPLMLGHVLCWQSAFDAQSGKSEARYALIAGVVAGAATLARPSWLLFTPFLFGVGLVCGPRRMKHSRIFLFTMLAFCVVMSPWWVRNARVTGHFVPTTLQVGPSLYDGLHAGATGASDEGMEFMRELESAQTQADAQSQSPLDSTFEYRLNQLAQREAMGWALSHPYAVAELAVAKFLKTWSFSFSSDGADSRAVKAVISATTALVMLLAIAGTWRAGWQMGWKLAVCWVPCLYFTALHMVFVGSIRYREPAILVLIAVAAWGVIVFSSGRSSRAKD